MDQILLEKLNSIEKKIDLKHSHRYLDIKETSEFTSLSISTIRRAVNKGQLNCSRKLGKLLFQESDIQRWLNG
ncbi:MAG: helix-turn-helix domain-containing protein [Candidatus Marinimicrobia bacterium]|nr:helix-turn-helix domain-containing protein [Candidatus Neomarinimicrobiota bacterium]